MAGDQMIQRLQLNGIDVHVTQYPLVATITTKCEYVSRQYIFHNPQPIEGVLGFLDQETFELRVVDLNARDAGQRDFGRYFVSLVDEDGSLTGHWIADRYEILEA